MREGSALRLLPEKQRQTLVLHYSADLTVEQIAADLPRLDVHGVLNLPASCMTGPGASDSGD